MHIEQDNTQLKLGCLNPNQYKYLPDEAVECTKLICKFSGKVEVYLSHEYLFFFSPWQKKPYFIIILLSQFFLSVLIRTVCRNIPRYESQSSEII